MTMHLGEQIDDTMFLYERSRFHSAVTGVIITSILTVSLGIFVWPVLKDMLYSQFNTLQMTAVLLGGAFAVMVMIWLYFIVRLLIQFRGYIIASRKQRRSILLGCVALAIALLCAVAVPAVVLIFNPIT